MPTTARQCAASAQRTTTIRSTPTRPCSLSTPPRAPSATLARTWTDSEREPIGSEVYQPLLDRLTSQQVGADNLVFLLVPVKYHFKSSSTEVFDFQFIGKGPGYALREGRIFAIQWSRPS